MEWYWVPADRSFLPFGHAFGSQDWVQEPRRPAGVGEVPDTWAYTRGDGDPGEQTGVPCGTLDQWRFGCRLADAASTELDVAGRLPCCVPQGRTGVPMDATMKVWLAGDSLAGEAVNSSLPEWPNRADPGNPAREDNPAFWPSVQLDFPAGLPCALFSGVQGLRLTRDVSGLKWTLYCVFLPARDAICPFGTFIAGQLCRLNAQRNDIGLTRTVSCFVGDGAETLTAFAPGNTWTAPIVAMVDYDGSGYRFIVRGGIEGQSTKASAGRINQFGAIGGLPGTAQNDPCRVAEVMLWKRLLTAPDHDRVLSYLHSVYTF